MPKQCQFANAMSELELILGLCAQVLNVVIYYITADIVLYFLRSFFSFDAGPTD
jgi:hypothetical protein